VYRRYYSPSDHADVLEMMTGYYNASLQPTPQQPNIVRGISQHALQIRGFDRLFVGLLIPDRFETFLTAEMDWRAELCCTSVILAAERYRRDTGRLPDSIVALVPKYLSGIPADPYTGEPLRCRRESDRFVVYSVGRDVEDNGGTLDRTNPAAPGTDIGCTLWDVNHRRQPPPPPEAPP
jgi:hypothetical protein